MEPHIELIFFGLLVDVSGLAVVARLVSIPYPIPVSYTHLTLPTNREV